MKNTLTSMLLASATLALFATSAPAQVITNYTNISNWASGGDVVGLPDGTIAMTNASATYADDDNLPVGALNLSGNDPLAAGGDLEGFIGAQVGALDHDIINQAEEGSAIKMTFNVVAGETLTIDWNMVTNDTTSSGIGLDTFFLYSTLNGAVTSLATSGEATLTSTTPNYAMGTGNEVSTYTWTKSGTETLSLGIDDVGDYDNSTQVVLTGITVSTAAVPEPSSAAEFAVGLMVLGLIVLIRRASQPRQQA